MFVLGFAEILRNLLACRGIKCKFILCEKHAINQVMINGKWYNVDLTLDHEDIKNGEINDQSLMFCLRSDDFFQCYKYHTPESYSVAVSCSEDYDRKILKNIYVDTLKRYEKGNSIKKELTASYDGTNLTLGTIGDLGAATKKFLKHEEMKEEIQESQDQH